MGGDRARAAKLVADVIGLSEAQAATEYAEVLRDFAERHWQTEQLFEERYVEIETMLELHDSPISLARKRLIGAYFCHEYTYAAAALMNPSIVPHPDQSGMNEGAVRFVMSLRAVGEGHISSIVFREGIAKPDGSFDLWPQSHFATSMLPDDSAAACRAGDCAVTVHRHANSTLTNSLIFPITEKAGGRAGGFAPCPLRSRRWRLRMDRHLHRLFRLIDPVRTAAHTRFPAHRSRAHCRPRCAQQGHGIVSAKGRRAILHGRAAGWQEPLPAALGQP